MDDRKIQEDSIESDSPFYEETYSIYSDHLEDKDIVYCGPTNLRLKDLHEDGEVISNKNFDDVLQGPSIAQFLDYKDDVVEGTYLEDHFLVKTYEGKRKYLNTFDNKIFVNKYVNSFPLVKSSPIFNPSKFNYKMYCEFMEDMYIWNYRRATTKPNWISYRKKNRDRIRNILDEENASSIFEIQNNVSKANSSTENLINLEDSFDPLEELSNLNFDEKCYASGRMLNNGEVLKMNELPAASIRFHSPHYPQHYKIWQDPKRNCKQTPKEFSETFIRLITDNRVDKNVKKYYCYFRKYWAKLRTELEAVIDPCCVDVCIGLSSAAKELCNALEDLAVEKKIKLKEKERVKLAWKTFKKCYQIYRYLSELKEKKSRDYVTKRFPQSIKKWNECYNKNWKDDEKQKIINFFTSIEGILSKFQKNFYTFLNYPTSQDDEVVNKIEKDCIRKEPEYFCNFETINGFETLPKNKYAEHEINRLKKYCQQNVLKYARKLYKKSAKVLENINESFDEEQFLNRTYSGRIESSNNQDRVVINLIQVEDMYDEEDLEVMELYERMDYDEEINEEELAYEFREYEYGGEGYQYDDLHEEITDDLGSKVTEEELEIEEAEEIEVLESLEEEEEEGEDKRKRKGNSVPSKLLMFFPPSDQPLTYNNLLTQKNKCHLRNLRTNLKDVNEKLLHRSDFQELWILIKLLVRQLVHYGIIKKKLTLIRTKHDKINDLMTIPFKDKVAKFHHKIPFVEVLLKEITKYDHNPGEMLKIIIKKRKKILKAKELQNNCKISLSLDYLMQCLVGEDKEINNTKKLFKEPYEDMAAENEHDLKIIAKYLLSKLIICQLLGQDTSFHAKNEPDIKEFSLFLLSLFRQRLKKGMFDEEEEEMNEIEWKGEEEILIGERKFYYAEEEKLYEEAGNLWDKEMELKRKVEEEMEELEEELEDEERKPHLYGQHVYGEETYGEYGEEFVQNKLGNDMISYADNNEDEHFGETEDHELTEALEEEDDSATEELDEVEIFRELILCLTDILAPEELLEVLLENFKICPKKLENIDIPDVYIDIPDILNSIVSVLKKLKKSASKSSLLDQLTVLEQNLEELEPSTKKKENFFQLFDHALPLLPPIPLFSDTKCLHCPQKDEIKQITFEEGTDLNNHLAIFFAYLKNDNKMITLENINSINDQKFIIDDKLLLFKFLKICCNRKNLEVCLKDKSELEDKKLDSSVLQLFENVEEVINECNQKETENIRKNYNKTLRTDRTPVKLDSIRSKEYYINYNDVIDKVSAHEEEKNELFKLQNIYKEMNGLKIEEVKIENIFSTVKTLLKDIKDTNVSSIKKTIIKHILIESADKIILFTDNYLNELTDKFNLNYENLTLNLYTISCWQKCIRTVKDIICNLKFLKNRIEKDSLIEEDEIQKKMTTKFKKTKDEYCIYILNTVKDCFNEALLKVIFLKGTLLATLKINEEIKNKIILLEEAISNLMKAFNSINKMLDIKIQYLGKNIYCICDNLGKEVEKFVKKFKIVLAYLKLQKNVYMNDCIETEQAKNEEIMAETDQLDDSPKTTINMMNEIREEEENDWFEEEEEEMFAEEESSNEKCEQDTINLKIMNKRKSKKSSENKRNKKNEFLIYNFLVELDFEEQAQIETDEESMVDDWYEEIETEETEQSENPSELFDTSKPLSSDESANNEYENHFESLEIIDESVDMVFGEDLDWISLIPWGQTPSDPDWDIVPQQDRLFLQEFQKKLWEPTIPSLSDPNINLAPEVVAELRSFQGTLVCEYFAEEIFERAYYDIDIFEMIRVTFKNIFKKFNKIVTVLLREEHNKKIIAETENRVRTIILSLIPKVRGLTPFDEQQLYMRNWTSKYYKDIEFDMENKDGIFWNYWKDEDEISAKEETLKTEADEILENFDDYPNAEIFINKPNKFPLGIGYSKQHTDQSFNREEWKAAAKVQIKQLVNKYHLERLHQTEKLLRTLYYIKKGLNQSTSHRIHCIHYRRKVMEYILKNCSHLEEFKKCLDEIIYEEIKEIPPDKRLQSVEIGRGSETDLYRKCHSDALIVKNFKLQSKTLAETLYRKIKKAFLLDYKGYVNRHVYKRHKDLVKAMNPNIKIERDSLFELPPVSGFYGELLRLTDYYLSTQHHVDWYHKRDQNSVNVNYNNYTNVRSEIDLLAVLRGVIPFNWVQKHRNKSRTYRRPALWIGNTRDSQKNWIENSQMDTFI